MFFSSIKRFNFILIFNILALLAFFILLGVTIHDKQLMYNGFTYLSYYLIFLLTILWVMALVLLWHERKVPVLSFLRQHWKGIIYSLLLTSVIFISVPKHFRVLSDETNLLSVSKSMTFQKHVLNITEGKYYYRMFWPTMNISVEKRPFLFPFFTSLMHSIFGYRVANVFILNFFVFWTALFLLYLLLHKYLENLWNFCALTLVAAQPVIALSAASGSFEIFNFLFILSSFLSLRYFLLNRDSSSFLVLILNLIMLANIRYESVLFLIVITTILSIARYIHAEFFKKSFWYSLLPFFIIPVIWQRILMINAPDINLPGGWTKAFGLKQIIDNVGVTFKYFMDLTGQSGYAGCINGLGLLALLILIIGFLTKSKNTLERNLSVFLISLLTSLFAIFLVVISYRTDYHPMNGRLYISILAALSIMPILLAGIIFKGNPRSGIIGVIICSSLFIFYHPIATEDRSTNNLIGNREFQFIDDFLKKNADKDSLIIATKPGQISVYNYGAISFATANNEAGGILFQHKSHLYSSVYVIQSISYNNQKPLPEEALDVRYKLETITETEMSGLYYLRISRVIPPQ